MSLDTRTQHYQVLLQVLLRLSFSLFLSTLTLCLLVGGLASPAPVVSVKNEENWTEVYTVLSTLTVAAHFFLADSPSPSFSGTGERRIMGNDCLSTVSHSGS